MKEIAQFVIGYYQRQVSQKCHEAVLTLEETT
jgi:hypothetical protein